MQQPLIPLVTLGFKVYIWLVITRVLLSWVPHDPYHKVIRYIYDITEPVLLPFRKAFGSRMGIDFSPILAIIFLQVLETITINLLLML